MEIFSYGSADGYGSKSRNGIGRGYGSADGYGFGNGTGDGRGIGNGEGSGYSGDGDISEDYLIYLGDGHGKKNGTGICY